MHKVFLNKLYTCRNFLWMLNLRTIKFTNISKNKVFMGNSEFETRHDKTNKMSVHPSKTQINLDICPVWSESLLCTQWVAKDPSFLHADSEDSDQSGGMPRLFWVFAATLISMGGCQGWSESSLHTHFVDLSCCGSFTILPKAIALSFLK